MLSMRRTGLALTLVVGLVIMPVACANAAKQMPDSFADVVEKLMPAVVNISTTQTVKQERFMRKLPLPGFPPGGQFDEFRDFFEQLEPQNPGDGSAESKATSLGAGFVIDPAGYIVTNNHVIADADEIMVTFSDETQLSATVVGRDDKTDLALLKVDAKKKLASVDFGDSDAARVGDWVMAIGNPFGLGGSVSAGIISARARDIHAGPFDDFIQTDAVINKGNSGGPLFNLEGKVIGVNTAIFSPSGGSVGIGFAVPSSLTEPVIRQLREYGRTHRGWLGVKIQMVTKEVAESLGLKEENGALVAEITKDSPADKAHIQVGDVIVSFDGKDITAMRKLPRIVADTKIGKQTTVVVWRNGKKLSLNVTLGEAKDSAIAETKQSSEEQQDEELLSQAEDIWGMKVLNLTGELRNQYGIAPALEGILILSVTDATSGINTSVMPGDIVTGVNQVQVKTVEQFRKEVTEIQKKGRKTVLLLINRGGETTFVTIPIEKEVKKKSN